MTFKRRLQVLTSMLWFVWQADKSRVKDYIHRLDNFDGPAVGEIAVGYEMFEEAFEIYKKFGLKTQAIKVLLDHQEDLDRALEYALKVLTITYIDCSPSEKFPCGDSLWTRGDFLKGQTCVWFQ